MTSTAPQKKSWIAEQVRRFREVRPLYRELAAKLDEILGALVREVAPTAIVTTRAKSFESFAEKIVRNAYANPLQQLTDLCGVRVITRSRTELDAVTKRLEQRFDIDWENSSDTSKRLQPTEFGYRSIHYIVQLRQSENYGVDVPDALVGLRAEVQVRTMAEHAWADFAHDLSYKGAFPIPKQWSRELAVLAAQLEEVDRDFGRIEARLRDYVTTYGRILSDEEAAAEIERLEVVLEQLDDREAAAPIAARIGKLAIAREDWAKAVDVMSPYVADPPQTTLHPLLRDLGVALCKWHKEHRSDPERRAEFERGQRYLELVSQRRPADPDALASCAGSWKGIDDDRSHDLYRQAVECDPADPYALGNYLQYELRADPDRLGLARALLGPAMQRCRQHAAVGINLPWALYDLGKFHLLRGDPYQAVDAYAQALHASTASWMIRTSLGSRGKSTDDPEAAESIDDPKAAKSSHGVESLSNLDLQGVDWIVRLLSLGLAIRTGDTASLLKRFPSSDPPISGPIVIVAGGTDPRVQDQLASYAGLLREAFADFRGTLIGGGTSQGVSGLVGELAAASGGRLRAIGYLPTKLPDNATPDDRYDDLRRTIGDEFSPLEPLQSWIDLIASGIDPSTVRIIGINGGQISAAEFRIALGLGATVGVIAQSGREAGRISAEPGWADSAQLVTLPEDSARLRRFLIAD